jgi:rubrerythrin
MGALSGARGVLLEKVYNPRIPASRDSEERIQGGTMTSFNTVDDILDFAIKEEEGAVEFYTGLAGRASPEMKQAFEAFAAEETGHRAKLLDIKAGKQVMAARGAIVDLKISDYLVEVAPSPNMSYRDALILAMKKEKAAFRMYSDLAARTQGALREIFLGLAQEEAKHKLRFEVEYDDDFLREA